MNAVEIIEKVLAADGLKKTMFTVPEAGVSREVLAQLSSPLARPLSEQHMRILERWNGINLDVIRVGGVNSSDRGIGDLMSEGFQSFAPAPGFVAFGSNFVGFVFVEAEDGSIWSADTDGDALTYLADDMDDFFVRLVFGKDAAEFMTEDWLADLQAAGIV